MPAEAQRHCEDTQPPRVYDHADNTVSVLLAYVIECASIRRSVLPGTRLRVSLQIVCVSISAKTLALGLNILPVFKKSALLIY